MKVDRPSLLTRVVLAVLLWVYRRRKLKILGQAPETKRFVIVGAPHTRNWDFIFFLGGTHQLGIHPAVMGKHSLFKWPMERFMREMGGVPVVRSSRHNYVEQMIDEFGKRDEFMLVIAPEGTRKGAAKWKSGFYHIAIGAGVPIVPGWVDYEAGCAGLGPAIMPTGDYSADMARIAAFFAEVMPGHPRLKAIMQGLENND